MGKSAETWPERRLIAQLRVLPCALKAGLSGECDIISSTAHTSIAHRSRPPKLHSLFQIHIHTSCAPRCATMDSSRKRKATNATPSANADGSATKKIKLVVRVSPHERCWPAWRVALAMFAQASGAMIFVSFDRSVGGGGVVRCRWDGLWKEERPSSRRDGALDFEPNTTHLVILPLICPGRLAPTSRTHAPATF